MLDMLLLAAKVALPNDYHDARNFWLGCVGIRQDGAIVSGKNGAVHCTSINEYQLIPNSHAEGRVLRKLGKGGTIFVSRVSKINHSLAMAYPCPTCQVRITSFQVNKVYYTINPNQYGIWSVKKDLHRVVNC